MQNGEYVVGEFNQLKAEPWSTDHTKMNYSLILNQPYQDGYGNTQVQVARIDVQPDDYSRLQSKASEMIDKRLLVPVIISARKSKSGDAWKSVRFVKDGNVKVLTEKKES